MNDTRTTRPAPQSTLAFNGERPEPLLGDYALGAGHRLYNPVLQRFHSADRLSPFDEGGINGYAYCLGDPLNNLDPSGNIPVFVHSFRELLQKTQAFWRSTGGTVFSRMANRNPDVLTYQAMTPSAAAATLQLPASGNVILPSTSMYRLTRTPPPVSGLTQDPSTRLAGLMKRAKGWREPPPPPRFPNTGGRLWIRVDPPPPQSPRIRDTSLDLQKQMKSLRRRLKRSILRAALVRAADKRVKAHRDDSFGPWWKP